MRPDLPTGTVTFLFTDVEGSTKLLNELGSKEYADALAEHRRVIREACASEGGVEVDTQGDAFFVAFPTALGALSAAREMTGALASGPIRVRVGTHTGTPFVSEEGYVGPDVHRAARIAAVAHGGQVVVSSATAALVDSGMLQDLGEHRLKDLSAPERIYQLGGQEFPPLNSLYQTNLPVPSTPFLGREHELQEVVDLLSRPDVRLLTLTGPGGIGKTRLGAQAAGLASDDFPGGVWWVPLAALRDPELVLQDAAQVLGAKAGLAAHIGSKRQLVLFDNFEQVADAADGLGDLLGACPNLKLLATSREALHLSGEQEYPVPALAPEEGIGFFHARARAGRPDFEANGAVSEICRRLDNLPLALELAAARVKVLSPEKILERLEQRLPLLTGGARDAPERQRTLEATIEWSHNLLAEEEQRLFRRLSVFAGGCTLEAAEVIAEAGLDTLQSLVEKSLLRFSNDRYWMLETIREFGADRLDGSDEAEKIRQRHAELFVLLCEEAEPGLEGPDSEAWLGRLDGEIGNVRAALEWAVASDHVLAMRLVATLWNYWPVRGQPGEARRHLEEAWTDAAPVEVQKRALRAWAASATSTFDAPGLAALSERRLELAHATNDLVHASGALSGLAAAARFEGDPARARRLYEEALGLARESGEQGRVMNVLGNLAHVAFDEGNFREARELLEENLRFHRAEGDELGIEWALFSLAQVAAEEEEYDDAGRLAREALGIAKRLGDIDLLPLLLGIVAKVAIDKGQVQDAAVLAGAAEALAESAGMSFPAVIRLRGGPYGSDSVREALEASESEALFARGRLLQVEDATELALNCLA